MNGRLRLIAMLAAVLPLLIGGCNRAIRAVSSPPAVGAQPSVASPGGRPEVVIQVNDIRRQREVSFAARAPRLAVIGEDQADVWDTATWSRLRSFTLDDRLGPWGERAQACALSPDGKALAVAYPGEVRIWDVATGNLARTLGPSVQRPEALAWSADGARLGAAGEVLRVWDMASGTARTIGLGNAESYSGGALAFSGDGALVATVDGDAVSLYRTDTGARVCVFTDRSGVWGPVALSPDGRTLATAGEDPNWDPGPLPQDEFGNEFVPSEAFYAHQLKVKVWDTQTGKLKRLLPGHGNSDGTSTLQFTPDGRRLYSGGDFYSSLWEVRTGKAIRSFDNSGPTAMSPDGRLIAVGSGQRILSAATGKRVASLHQPPQPVTALAFSPDGKTLAAGESLGVRLWDLETIRVLHALGGPPAGSDRPLIGFLPDGTLYQSSLNGTFVWNPATGKRLRSLRGPNVQDTYSGMIERNWQLLAPDGKTTVNESGGGLRKTFEVRDAATKQVRATVPVDSGWLLDATFSPDGRTMAFIKNSLRGQPTQSIEVWDIRKGSKVSEIADIGMAAAFLAFSPDAKTLAGALPSPVRMPEGRYVTEHYLVLWDVASGREVRRITLDRPFWALAFSRDGRTLAAGAGNPSDPDARMASEGAVRLFDARTLKQAATLTGGEASVRAVAFSPDGRRIAAGDADGRVRLWDVSRGRLLVTLTGFPTRDGAKVSPEWLAETPDGTVDWSPGAATLVRWRKAGALYPARQFEAPYCRRIRM